MCYCQHLEGAQPSTLTKYGLDSRGTTNIKQLNLAAGSLNGLNSTFRIQILGLALGAKIADKLL